MKRILIILLSALCLTAVKAERVDSLFAAMPDSIIPLLSHDNRLDCLDFYRSHMTTSVTNRLGGKSRITSLSPRCLRLQVTSLSDAEISLWEREGEKPLLMLIYTYHTPAAESIITIYDCSWKKLRTSDFISQPVISSFINVYGSDGDGKASHISAILSEAGIEARADSAVTSVVFSLSLKALGPDVLPEVKSCTSSPLIFQWDGRRFSPSAHPQAAKQG